MKICLVRITGHGQARSHLFFRSPVTLGTSPRADLLLADPEWKGDSLAVRDGRFAPAAALPKGVGPLREGRSLQVGSTRVDLFSLSAWIPGAVLSICLALGGAAALALDPGAPRVGPQDWAAVPLPAMEPRGNCKEDRSHPDGVRFSFPSPPRPGSRLAFVLGGMERGSVTLFMDGAPFFGPVPLPAGWGEETIIELPSAPPVGGEPRRLEFRLQGRVDGETPVPWCVRDARVIPPDPDAPDRPASLPTLFAMPGPDAPAAVLVRAYRTLPPDRVEDRKKLERAMAKLLTSDLVRLRSLASAGSAAEAGRLREQIRRWLPLEWTEGRRMFDECASR